MGEDRNPASFWYCGGRLGARAGQDSAYWRPESAARSRPLAACLLGVSQQRPPPPEHSEPRGLGNVIVTLATVDGNAVHSPPAPGSGGGASAGRNPPSAGRPRLQPRPLRCRGWDGAWASAAGVAAGVQGAARLGARCRPRAHHPSTRFSRGRCLRLLELAPLSFRSLPQRCLP